MRYSSKLAALTAAVAIGCAFSTPASAQATRTWVSGVGDDVNPCSRTAPCKTFAGAILKTAAGGEISCIDPAGYGGVTITKSIAIVCDEVDAGVLSPMTNGITINAGANDTVFISGLEIYGAGSGVKGIRYLSAGAVHVHNSKIHKMQGSNGAGISFAPSSFGNLTVSDSVIANNGSGTTGGGIEIVPTGNATSKVTLQNVQFKSNTNGGIRVDVSGATGGSVSLVVADSHVVGGIAGVTVNAPGAGAASVTIVRTEISNNFGTALTANGANATVRVSDSTITGNQSGVFFTSGATIASYTDNRLNGNPARGAANDGSFSATLTKQ